MSESLELTTGGHVGDVLRLALGASMARAEPRRVGSADMPFIVIPDDHAIKSLEHTLEQPFRIRAKVELNDAASFIAYINKHKLEETALYGSMGDKPVFVGVIDDNAAGVAAWREHKATYACPLSHEWDTWNSSLHNGKAKTQVEFARFVEDNLLDIVEPSAAEVLAVSRTLEAKKAVSFSSGVRLDNGDVQFLYNEETKGTAGKGTIDVPERFTIAIPVFEGGDKYAIDARLRYRISDTGQLSMWYELERPHKVIEHATKEVWKAIAEGTSLTIINGNPFAS